MAVTSVSPDSALQIPPWARRLAVPGGLVLVALLIVLIGGADVPTWLDNHLQSRMLTIYKWISSNRTSNWLFTGVFNPISDGIDGLVRAVWWILRTIRWSGVLVLTALIGWQTGGRRGMIWGTVSMALVGVVGYWDLTMITMSEMITAIVIAILIGVPLGIWTSRSARAETVVRAVLDTAQVMPVFAYLGILTLAFSIGFPPAVVATIIYAVPPAVRMTNHGLRNVPAVLDEVGRSFGASTRQHLLKVQLPVARRTILLGLNQVIMMAFGIVVIGSILGTGEVGGEVLKGLQKQDIGVSFAAGLAIVFAAISLDRITTGDRDGQRTSSRNLYTTLPAARQWLVGLAAVVVVAALTKIVSDGSFPSALTIDIKPATRDVVDWIQDNFRNGVPIIGGTQSISDFVTLHLLNPIRSFLQWLPWLVVIALLAAVGYVSKGWKLAVTVALCLVAIASMGTVLGGDEGRTRLWDLGMDTLSQVLVAVVLSVLIAVPLGIWAGRSDRVFSLIRPALDVAQVLPQFVYLVPVIALVNPGRSAGVLAALIYAIPPGIRLTALGLKEVPFAPREAAISFGATPRQELFKVQLPLAVRSVLLGVNQTILMVLATVVIAALIGGGGLGLVSLGGFIKQQQNFGQGMAAGLSIVLLAIVLDRITQAWGTPRSSTQQRGDT